MADAFKYEVVDNFDFVIEEKGNTSINIRKIVWGDSENAKVDIRKYFYKDGEERMSKGVSLSDEGADELVKTLCENGYGNTRDILKGIKNRPDFDEALKNIDSDEEYESDDGDDYYDPKQLLA